MKGTIVSNRRGINRLHTTQYILKAEDEKYTNKKASSELSGKKVIYTTISGKIINGKISSAHGNNGLVKVIFERSLPGTAIRDNVEIK
jgi:ribosomal protein L35AE/L33A